ncbi:MAG: hypothetical protein HUK26_09575 [Duodenibacillus sp.]|nr:hypothetical protein [Duodenibacillus sp.]
MNSNLILYCDVSASRISVMGLKASSGSVTRLFGLSGRLVAFTNYSVVVRESLNGPATVYDAAGKRIARCEA